MSDSWNLGGATALQLFAPTAAAALGAIGSAWPESVPAPRMRTIRTVTAEGIGLPPLRRPPTGPMRTPEVPESAVMEFAEQFAVDVTQIGAALRVAWLETVLDAAFDSTLVVYISDMLPRVRVALDAVFGEDAWFDAQPLPTRRARDLMDELLREVALLDQLDPVLTELIRLRGARHHQCRVCMARRSLPALEQGADASVFEDLDHYRDSSLTPAQKAALGLVDGMVWTPADLRTADLAAVRAHLTPAQVVEVVLDVARNASNKIAVALGGDAPERPGLQLFDLDEGGQLIFP